MDRRGDRSIFFARKIADAFQERQVAVIVSQLKGQDEECRDFIPAELGRVVVGKFVTLLV